MERSLFTGQAHAGGVREARRAATLRMAALLLATGGLIGVALVPERACAQSPAAATASAQPVVRAEFAQPFNAAQAHLAAGRIEEASASLQAAAALPNATPQEVMLLARARAALAQRQGDDAQVLKWLEVALDTGQVPAADLAGLSEVLVGLAFKLQDHARVLRWSQRHADFGGTRDAVRLLRIQSQIATGDESGAMRALMERVASGDTSGQVQPEAHLRTLLSLQRKLKDAQAARTLERLAVAYPRPEYWMDLVLQAARDPGLQDRTLIQLYRLLRQVGGVKSLQLGQEMARMALTLGQPEEALAVLDEAYPTGTNPPQQQAAALRVLREQALRQTAAERADRAAAEAAARAAADGNGLVDLGWARVASLPPGAPAGQVQPGIALIEQGLDRGGLRRPAEARLLWFIAQVMAGRKDLALAAAPSMRDTSGADAMAEALRLWTLFAQSPEMLPTRQ